MNTNRSKLLTFFGLADVVLILAACFLSVKSSGLAYALTDLNIVIGCSAGAAVLALLAVLLNGRTGLSVLIDICLFGNIILTIYAFSRVIMGRLNLMGYIWFSDLEKGNPAAVSALNLSVAAWVCFLLGALLVIILGFRKN